MEQDFRMTEEQYADLQRRVAEGECGEEAVFFCNVIPRDHIHVRRLGAERDGLRGRVGVLTHGTLTGTTTFYLSPFEARMLAASLLNAADELDGDTPLLFFPPRFVGGDEADRPE